jgi:hypothetical protein
MGNEQFARRLLEEAAHVRLCRKQLQCALHFFDQPGTAVFMSFLKLLIILLKFTTGSHSPDDALHATF